MRVELKQFEGFLVQRRSEPWRDRLPLYGPKAVLDVESAENSPGRVHRHLLEAGDGRCPRKGAKIAKGDSPSPEDLNR